MLLWKRLVPKPIRNAIYERRLTRVSQQAEFQAVGQGTMQMLIDLGGLQPDEAVLDVGCGLGRIALPLTRYLKPPGRYEGFDILEGEISWATRHITRPYPHFRFQLAQLHNKYYHSEMPEAAAAFRFPYGDAAFDFVFLSSVFTHMLRADMEQYLAEIARVLKPQGRCLISYFLLGTQAASPRSREGFPHADDGCFLRDKALPEWEVAYEEQVVRRAYRQAGLQVQEPIHYAFQDWVLAVKP